MANTGEGGEVPPNLLNALSAASTGNLHRGLCLPLPRFFEERPPILTWQVLDVHHTHRPSAPVATRHHRPRHPKGHRHRMNRIEEALADRPPPSPGPGRESQLGWRPSFDPRCPECELHPPGTKRSIPSLAPLWAAPRSPTAACDLRRVGPQHLQEYHRRS